MTRKTLGSPKETAAFAKTLAKLFIDFGPSPKGATVIGFIGDLGAGKTSFIKSFLKTLGVKSRIMSPTFVIMKSFPLKRSRHGFKTAYHLDTYRIDSKGLLSLGLKNILSNRRNIVLIEWADKVKKVLPKNTLWVNISHGAHQKQRIFSLKGKI